MYFTLKLMKNYILDSVHDCRGKVWISLSEEAIALKTIWKERTNKLTTLAWRENAFFSLSENIDYETNLFIFPHMQYWR